MTPKGFWSYAQGDDKHLDGILSDLRGKVAGEVSMLLGHDIGIFQDIRDLRTGDRWEERLRQEVTAATFLVPVLTPRYFNRPFCREETLTFLRVAREQGVEPRIFPIRFVQFDDEDDDEVRAALGEFQYKDFSTWRTESDPTRRTRLLIEFAKDVKVRLKAASGSAPTHKTAQPGPALPEAPRGTSERLEASATSRPAPEPPSFATFTVDPLHRGDFTSIAAAIDAAPAGSRIVVRPGIYREALRLSKPLELTGEGDRERIVVTTAKGAALHCDAPMARVSGMTFRREAGAAGSAGVWITGGAPELEDCIIESGSSACVEIKGTGTAPTLRRCVMQNGAECGLLIHSGARPLAEDCEMVGSALAGVEIKGEGTHATLRRCVARDGQAGYSFHSGAGGLVERCEAVANAFSGIETKSGADPLLRDCVLADNRQAGALALGVGRGRLETCTIERNGLNGLEIRDGGVLVVTGCTIRGNGRQAVWIKGADSGGMFKDNDLRDNAKGAWLVDAGVGDRLVRERNKES